MSVAPFSELLVEGHSEDHRAGELLRSLGQPVLRRTPWGFLRTIVYGGLSFGILPLLVWPGQLSGLMAAEAQQARELADWVRTRGRVPAAVGPLRSAANAVAPRPALWILPMLIGLFIGVVLVGNFEYLLDETYRSPLAQEWPPESDFLHTVFGIWTAGLGAAYFFHWLQVRMHVADLRRFLSRFNQMADAERVAPIALPRNRWGLHPLWLLAGVLLASHGGWWAVPMMMAGAAQRRYACATSRAARGALAGRMRRMILAPLQDVPRCATVRCQAVLPVGAAFCPRCGTPAMAGSRPARTWAGG